MTAVEWLIEELKRIDNAFEKDSTDYTDSLRYAKDIAEDMEKQQIENAFTDGITGNNSGAIDAKQYYKETFNK